MPRFSCVLFLPSGWSSSFVRMDRNMERWKFVTAWWCEGSIPALPMSGRNDGWCRACLACIFNEEEGESKSRFLTPRVNHRTTGFFHNVLLLQESGVNQMVPNMWHNDKGWERDTCSYDSRDAVDIHATFNPLFKFSRVSVRGKVTIPPQETFKRNQGCWFRDNDQDLIEFGRCCFPQGLVSHAKRYRFCRCGLEDVRVVGKRGFYWTLCIQGVNVLQCC